jgi:APA family basic amino acid/polyamine antiporter
VIDGEDSRGAQAPHLRRRLGLAAAGAAVLGEVVGVGIFLTPAEMAHGLGSPFWLAAVWLFVAGTALCGALCYAELAARFPEAGGGYVYLRQAWGPGAAFLFGWQSLLVMDPGLTAALAVGAAGYASSLAPVLATHAKLFAIGAILLLAAVNAFGIRASAGLLEALTAGKVLLLVVIVGWGFLSGRGELAHFIPFVARRAGSAPFAAGLAGGLVAAFFSIAGFWDAAKLAGEVRDPARTLPRALALGVGAAGAIYLATSAVFVYLVPIEASADASGFVALAGQALFGPVGGRVLAAAVVVTVLGCLAAVMILFLRAVAALDPRHGAPRRAIAVQAVLASALVTVGSFGEIVAYFIFVTVAFVALTVAGVFRLPRPQPGGYRTPGYPWTPLAFLLLLTTILVLLAAGRPAQVAAGAAVVALGIPVYLLTAGRPRR